MAIIIDKIDKNKILTNYIIMHSSVLGISFGIYCYLRIAHYFEDTAYDNTTFL